jgi:hypothetical protein
MMSDLNSAIVFNFQDKAAFRRRMADKSISGSKPDDQKRVKNEIYADSIDMMVKYVESLPNDFPLLIELDKATYQEWSGCHDLNDFEADAAAVHFGDFMRGLKPEECARKFQLWAEGLIESAREKREKTETE